MCVFSQDLLGPSLEDLWILCDRKFTLRTVTLLADHMVSSPHPVPLSTCLRSLGSPGLGKSVCRRQGFFFGRSLLVLHKETIAPSKSSPCNVIRLPLQITRIEDLHTRGYLWRGVKPDNFW